MVELTECPVCASRKLAPLMTTVSRFDPGFADRAAAEVNHILHNVLDRDKVVTRAMQCGECRHMFLSPTFTDVQIARMYSADATEQMRAYYAKVGKPGPHPREAAALAADTPAKPVAATLPSANDIRYRLIPDIVLPHARGKGGKVLDVGGGTGKNISGFAGFEKYVHDLKKAGTNEGVTSVDMESARALAPFDVLVSTHTFEHIVHPAEALRSYLPLIKPGSLFYVEVPSDYTNVLLKKWLRPLLKKGVVIHWHINFFSPASLERLFGDSGFETIRLESLYRPYGAINTYTIMALFRYTGNPVRTRGAWTARMVTDLIRKLGGKPFYRIRRRLFP